MIKLFAFFALLTGVNLAGPPPPGHVIMGQPQSMGMGPPVAQVSMSGPLVTHMTPPHGVTVPPGVQLVSQATLQPVQQQQPVQTFFAQVKIGCLFPAQMQKELMSDICH